MNAREEVRLAGLRSCCRAPPCEPYGGDTSTSEDKDKDQGRLLGKWLALVLAVVRLFVELLH